MLIRPSGDWRFWLLLAMLMCAPLSIAAAAYPRLLAAWLLWALALREMLRSRT